MTTIIPAVYTCPNCKNEMYSFELASYTIHSSIVYSDGKSISSPPVMFNKPILICSECNKPFWKDDATREDAQRSDPDQELPEARDISDLFEPFEKDRNIKLARYYSGLLETGFANTTEREIYLRTELWRTLNNDFRNQKEDSVTDKLKESIEDLFYNTKEKETRAPEERKMFINNLRKLISVFKPENDDEQLLLAEMYRELGEFDRALYILNKIGQHERNDFYDKILKAVKQKRSGVFRLN